MESLFEGRFRRNTMDLDQVVVEVRDNPDSTDAGKNGDNFVLWPVLVELDAEGKPEGSDIVAETTRTLTSLWDSGYRAVAACDFEDRLPRNGGIRRDPGRAGG